MRLAKDYRAMGNFAIPITENRKLINLQSSAYFFFPGALAFNHSLTHR